MGIYLTKCTSGLLEMDSMIMMLCFYLLLYLSARLWNTETTRSSTGDTRHCSSLSELMERR